jgi:hypothetical protein
MTADMRWRSVAAAALALASAGTWTACAAAPATPEQLRQEERRLLAPFLTAREVGCSELLVELTGNFHQNVGQPAVDRSRHTVDREQRDGYTETVWTNTAGTPEGAFVVAIGDATSLGETDWVRGQQTRFRVVNRVRIRVHEQRRELTLAATASGPPIVIKDANGPLRDAASFAIADGVLQR